MKYIAPILAFTLLFVGAGCTADTEQTIDEPTDTTPEVQEINPDLPYFELNLDGDPSTPLSDDTEIEEGFNKVDSSVGIEFEDAE